MPDISVNAPVNMSIDRFLLSLIRTLAINPCIMGVTLFMRYCSMSVSLAGHRRLPIFASELISISHKHIYLGSDWLQQVWVHFVKYSLKAASLNLKTALNMILYVVLVCFWLYCLITTWNMTVLGDSVDVTNLGIEKSDSGTVSPLLSDICYSSIVFGCIS